MNLLISKTNISFLLEGAGVERVILINWLSFGIGAAKNEKSRQAFNRQLPKLRNHALITYFSDSRINSAREAYFTILLHMTANPP